MGFDNFGITSAGYELIAQATSGKTIIFVEALADDGAITDIYNATKSLINDVRGSIKAASATAKSARIDAEFTNDSISTSKNLRTFGITAKLSDAADSTAVLFAVATMYSGAIALQPLSETNNVVIHFNVPFNLTFEGASTYVEGTPGGNASIGDLDRFVSCHGAGDTGVGEMQTVRGSKTFMDQLTVQDSVTVTGVLTVGGELTVPQIGSENSEIVIYESNLIMDGSDLNMGGGQITGCSYVDIAGDLHVQDILPYENSNNIGTDGNRFGSVWAINLHGAIPTASWGATNVYTGEYGSIVCVKETNGVARKPGDVFLPPSATAVNLCALDGTVSGTAPYGYYKVVSYTDGTKPFLAIYLAALVEG